MRTVMRRYATRRSGKDYYTVLGVPQNASHAEIKAAYFKLAKQLHPDAPTGNEAKFKETVEAYEVIGSEESRARYDAGMHPTSDKSPYDDAFHEAMRQEAARQYEEFRRWEQRRSAPFADFIREKETRSFRSFRTAFYYDYGPLGGKRRTRWRKPQYQEEPEDFRPPITGGMRILKTAGMILGTLFVFSILDEKWRSRGNMGHYNRSDPR